MKHEHILGIELGSTRIKAVLTDVNYQEIASGSHQWENHYENGLWTYAEAEIWEGLQCCYKNMAEDYERKCGEALTEISAIGLSGMMHGYLVFDEAGNLLTPFRTWRNTNTGQAADELTKLFSFPVPQRWSIAHLYQAILNQESHVKAVRYMTTLSGYVHWKLTGKRVLGVGDASGMFPINRETATYDEAMLAAFDERIADEKFPWRCRDILPDVCKAGEDAGHLTEEGAGMLDVTGNLKAGSVLCPPEGDAGTGMVAANAVRPCTGNVSAGTSIFAMVVLEKPLAEVYPEIDIVTTPEGSQVAMVHCNNCTSEINEWASLFQELLRGMGVEKTDAQLYQLLFESAAISDGDCGGVLCCNYHSGEPIANMEEGLPMLIHRADGHLSLGNFMRAQLYAAVATLKVGFDIIRNEGIRIDYLTGHGGLFKTPEVGQRILSEALKVPVCTMDHAGEGGAWGIALLAAYRLRQGMDGTLDDFLSQCVFRDTHRITICAKEEEQRRFDIYMKQYDNLLNIERVAIEELHERHR